MQHKLLVLSHRGFHLNERENTLQAFAEAITLGVDGIETDVRMTSDSVAILHHDPDLPDGRSLDSFSYEDLCRAAPYEIPTLESTLEKWQNVFWNLEIKTEGALDATLALVGKHLHTHRFLITSFLYPVVVEVGNRVPAEVKTGLLLDQRPNDLNSLLKELRTNSSVQTIVWDFHILDDEYVKQLSESGMQNFTYGAHGDDEHRQHLSWPIDGAIVDDPRFLLQLSE